MLGGIFEENKIKDKLQKFDNKITQDFSTIFLMILILR